MSTTGIPQTWHRVTVTVELSYALELDECESADDAAERAIDKVRHDLGEVIGRRDARDAAITATAVELCVSAGWVAV